MIEIKPLYFKLVISFKFRFNVHLPHREATLDKQLRRNVAEITVPIKYLNVKKREINLHCAGIPLPLPLKMYFYCKQPVGVRTFVGKDLQRVCENTFFHLTGFFHPRETHKRKIHVRCARDPFIFPRERTVYINFPRLKKKKNTPPPLECEQKSGPRA